MLNLKDLKYLVTIADTGHFGKAAERCFVSQPTLSAQLKKLEQTLGVQLVERQPNNVQLTEIGREVAERGRRMLAQSEEIIALARANTDPLGARLRMALIPTIGPYLLPRITQKIRKALPKLKLMLYEHQTENLLQRLREGEIDLGILALPVPDENLHTRVLYEENFVLAVPDGHALSKRSRIRVSDLDQQTVLLLEDGHCLRDQALEVCHHVDIREAENFRATSLETLRQMVVAGLGVTLLPALAVEPPFGGQRGMTTIAFNNPQPQRIVGAIWRKSTTNAAAIEAVCQVIETTLQ
jgi:LysR family transcriptional regulator, hydrogen peroxide-inducible genes activator